MSRRYVVRSVAGWQIVTTMRPGHGRTKHPNATVWVADEWSLGCEVALWRTEQYGGTREARLERAFANAQRLADRLNAEHERWLEQE